MPPELDQLSGAAWLENQRGDVLPLTGNLSIGRTAENQLVVEDQRVSRRHAMIHAQGGEFWLIDLGSRNGTCVAERRIFQPVRLHHGDRIRICSQSFVFHQPGTGSPMDTLTKSAFHTRTEVSSMACWLLVADIQDSTRLAQSLAQEELSILLGKWFQKCRSVIEKNGGMINKYLGDGFLAFWRARETGRDGLVEVARTLRAMQNEDLPVFRFVLHHGDVLFNSAISPNEENLSGAAMSFVFRMEKLAGSLGLSNLLSVEACEALEGGLNTVPAGEHALSGFNGKFSFLTFEN